jgi:hypothetical protein
VLVSSIVVGGVNCADVEGIGTLTVLLGLEAEISLVLVEEIRLDVDDPCTICAIFFLIDNEFFTYPSATLGDFHPPCCLR